MRTSFEVMAEVRTLLRQYCAECERADLKDLTKQTYTLHATNFVRWIAGDFKPGSRGRSK